MIAPDAMSSIDLAPGAVLTYNDLFAEAFDAASLDTSVKWNHAESSAGNVAIEAANDRLKLVGNNSWGTNGIFSNFSIARAAGLVFQCDFLIDATTSGLIFGWHDGAGHSFSDFAHGIDISNTSTNVFIFENGSSRGAVGSSTIAVDHWYRVRITIGAAGAAVYEIQGGHYGHFGSTSFTTITPGTTSSATDPLRVGVATVHAAVNHYVRNLIVYRT